MTGDDHAARRWQRSPDAVWRYTGDGVVLLAVQVGDVLTLDSAGSLVWQELREPVSVDELSRRVSQRVGLDVAAVAAGVRKVLERLAHDNLAVRHHG